MHQLTDTLAARVAIAVNIATEDARPIQIVEGEPVRLLCPFASTGKRQFDLQMAAAIADDYLATQPIWLVVVAVQFADGYTVLRADFSRYNAWVSQH
jgi:hypothetical protein